MPSQYIAIVAGAQTNKPYSVLNPDTDAQVTDPRLLLLQNENGEPVKLVKLLRSAYNLCTSTEQLENAIAVATVSVENVIADSVQTLALVRAKKHAKQGRTDQALTSLLSLLGVPA